MQQQPAFQAVAALLNLCRPGQVDTQRGLLFHAMAIGSSQAAKSQVGPALDECYIRGVLSQRSDFADNDPRNHCWGLHPSIWKQLDSRDRQIWDQLNRAASARGSKRIKIPDFLKVRRSPGSRGEKMFSILKVTKKNVPSPMRKVGCLSTFQPVSKLKAERTSCPEQSVRKVMKVQMLTC